MHTLSVCHLTSCKWCYIITTTLRKTSDVMSVVCLSSHLLGLGFLTLTWYYEPSNLPNLVAWIERSPLFQSKMDDPKQHIVKKDVFDLIESFAGSSSPTFTIPHSDFLSPNKQSIMVANAFDITGGIPEHSPLFSKGNFVHFNSKPHKLVEVYSQKCEEPKKNGKKKKGIASFRETTSNIWKHLCPTTTTLNTDVVSDF